MSISAYRALLRSTRIAFQGDTPLLTAARSQARTQFQTNASLSPTDPALGPAIAHALEVAKILRENVVQGKKTGEEGDMYKLRIHDETERGDNDTIKMPNGQSVVIDGKSCKER